MNSPSDPNASLPPSTLYARGVAERRWEDDPAQRTVLAHLDRIRAELIEAEKTQWWRRLRATAPVRGLYLHGPVGRGKTFLVDLFFDSLPLEARLRRHFHRFMQEVHAELKRLRGHEDPLVAVAAHLAASARVFCLDEFFVADIGDAMILGNLLRHLFARGVVLIATSNIAPHDLYQDGLQRERFLPAIGLLEKHCEIVPLPAARDYRLRALARAGVYFSPPGEAAEARLAAVFTEASSHSSLAPRTIDIGGRAIAVKRQGGGAIWFEFAAICEGPRAVADYIEIGDAFHTVLISNVPQFVDFSASEDAARRFVHLVDEFYDRGVVLALSAATAITDLYRGRRLKFEFARTESRLIEMQSQAYLLAGRKH